jgi:hypothetical protein
MIAPGLLALNAANGAIGDLPLRRAVIDHMNRKPAAQVPENAEPGNGLASRPEPDFPKAIPRQIRSTNSDGLPRKSHGSVPPSRLGALAKQRVFERIPASAIAFRISHPRIGYDMTMDENPYPKIRCSWPAAVVPMRGNARRHR